MADGDVDISMPAADVDTVSDIMETGGGFKAPTAIPSSAATPAAPAKLKEGVVVEPGSKVTTDPQGEHDEGSHQLFSPGERLKDIPVPYKEPVWGGLPPSGSGYKLEVLKSGRIISTVDLCKKSFYVFGRANNSDVVLEHPSISRHHAVVQFRCDPGSTDTETTKNKGMYIYDLGSTHFTFVNKTQIDAESYRRISVGHMIKFGKSTRTYILQGPAEDEEPESEMTITEMKQQKEMIKKLLLAKQLEKQQSSSPAGTGEGISWGMAEDAIEEDPVKNPSALTASWESMNIIDPKKTIRGFFEREGYELPEYEVEDKGRGSFFCRLELPVQDIVNEQVFAEALVSGKKKEAVAECAKDACRKLDAYGLLRQNPSGRRKKRLRNWEDDDYYDSDDDNFLDRTGAVEKKRIQRMRNSGKIEDTVETYESLNEKLKEVNKEKSEIRLKLEQNPDGNGNKTGGSEGATDSLDSFMTQMKTQTNIDQIERRKLKIKVLELQNETQRLQKLINKVKPTQLPEFKSSKMNVQLPHGNKPMIGHMKGHGTKSKISTSNPHLLKPSSANKSEENIVEEDEESSDEETKKPDEKQTETGTETHSSQPAKTVTTDSHSNIPSQLPDDGSRKQVKMSFTKPKLLTGETTAWETSDKPSSSLNRPTLIKGVELGQHSTSVSAGKKKSMKQFEPLHDDDTYSSWMPPPNQTGDGKTHLNEKFGY